jgi:hypothetical protein
MNIRLKFLCKSIFLFVFVFFGTTTSSFAFHTKYGIFLLSEKPMIDTTISDSINMTIDLTEEAKRQLTGNGTITIDIRKIQDYIDISTNTLLISYKDYKTIPATFEISLDREKMEKAGVTIENEKYLRTGFTFKTESNPFSIERTIDAIIHGEEYNIVKRYLEESGSLMEEESLSLVDYEVPAQYYTHFLQQTEKGRSSAPIAYQLDLGTNYREKLGYCPHPTGGVCPEFNEVYRLNAYGFESYEEFLDLAMEYAQKDIGYGRFSMKSKVPTDFFLKHLHKFEGEKNNIKDLNISHLYNKRQGKQMLQEARLDKKDIMKKLRKKYGVQDFSFVLPNVILNVGKTISDPQSTSDRPLAIYIRTSRLSEGTFSDKHLLSSLSETHNIILAQVEDNKALNNVLKHIEKTFPQADLLVLSSHGSSYGMEFIREDDTKSFGLISNVIKPEATIFLSSCSTAQREWRRPDGPFAYIFSNAVQGRTIIAAKDATYGQYLKYIPSAQDPSRKYTAYMHKTPIAIIKNGMELGFIK